MATKIALIIAIAVMGNLEISADQEEPQQVEITDLGKEFQISKTQTRKEKTEAALAEAVKTATEEKVKAQKEAERQEAIQTAAAEQEAREAAERARTSNKQNVLFTNFYTTDGSSSNTTASGLQTYDFQINELGFYTYQGKVVLAAANQSRLNRPMNSGYRSQELHTELVIELNGQTHQAIVLDVCGACYGMPGETEQRYDIFTTHEIIGKRPGAIYQ